jgi:hypothetical protein
MAAEAAQARQREIAPAGTEKQPKILTSRYTMWPSSKATGSGRDAGRNGEDLLIIKILVLSCVASGALSVAALEPSSAATREAVHVVTATSFADRTDLADYRKCIKRGKTPAYCRGLGDDGVGKWGDDTTSEDKPMCALPTRDWEAKWGKGNRARGKKIAVTYVGKTVICELRDTLGTPKNGAGIDLNPGAAKALGRKPPFKLYRVEWKWAE